ILIDKKLKNEYRGKLYSYGRSNRRWVAVFQRIGNQFRKDHPYHGTAGKAEAHRQVFAENMDEEKGGHRHQRLRKAGKDAPAHGFEGGNTARDKYQANRQAFGDVMHRNGCSNKEPKVKAAAE